ncbi:hypothetical protein GCM10023184_47360 [Flaviaesturariibacter amylovorans]|uniref:Lipoprotein n=2 Tax=Flaviaesturariibacter amylovorans TaxID=1084520 RepID=A0ABP8HVP1_9BACT
MLPLLLLALPVAAQKRGAGPELGDPKALVRSKLEAYRSANGGVFTDEDSVLRLTLPGDTPDRTVHFAYLFDGRARLRAYSYSGCVPCIGQYRTGILNDKKEGWRQRNDSTWHAARGRKVLRWQQGASGPFFTVERAQ